MNYLADLVLNFFRGQNRAFGIILFVVFAVVYYALPRPYTTVSCKSGKCSVSRGEKQLSVFNADEVDSCTVSSWLKHRRKARDRRYYYPVIILKDGSKVRIPSRIRSTNKSTIDSFCVDINAGNDFIYQRK